MKAWKINRWQCWIKGILRNLGGSLFTIDGHDYVDIEEYDNVKVTISKCSVCGKTEIMWTK